MTTDSLAMVTARANVRYNESTSPVIVRELLDRIDRLERAAELREED